MGTNDKKPFKSVSINQNLTTYPFCKRSIDVFLILTTETGTQAATHPSFSIREFSINIQKGMYNAVQVNCQTNLDTIVNVHKERVIEQVSFMKNRIAVFAQK